MTIEQKGKLIAAIISHMKFAYRNKLANLSSFEQRDVKPFDEGDTFFQLAFMSDAALRKLAKQINI